jgi:protein tyrosine/serine phosphatase
MIINFHEVASSIYRGGQPQTTEDWQSLLSYNISNVVKLNFVSEAIDLAPQGIDVKYHGMSPSTFLQIFDVPSLESVLSAVQDIKPGTYIHCEHGQDRTGLVVAAYRVLRCGLSLEDAKKEALSLGYHPELLGLDEAWERFVKFVNQSKC